MNTIIEENETPVSEAISDGLKKLKKDPVKEPKSKDKLNLLGIAKKLSARKFGKK